jgi:exonuclease III
VQLSTGLTLGQQVLSYVTGSFILKNNIMAVLKICSYNMKGFNQGKTLLTDLCESCDVIMVQEHWLLPQDLQTINNFSSNFTGFSSSAMECRTSKGLLKGRPYGGVGIIVKNAYSTHMKCLAAEERFIAIAWGDLILINMYLPCHKNIVSYNNDLLNVLTGIGSLIESNASLKVVIGGDLNCDLNSRHPGSVIIQEFMDKYQLSSCDPLGNSVTNTYINSALGHSSFIDHFIVHNSIYLDVLDFDVIDEGNNMSDHLPIFITMHTNLTCSNQCGETNSVPMKLRWDKANLSAYYNETLTNLSAVDLSHLLCSGGNHLCSGNCADAIDVVYNNMVGCLAESAYRTIPKTRCDFFKHWWDDNLSDLKSKSIEAHALWKEHGKPHKGAIYDIMKSAKAQYKRAIRQKDKSDFNIVSNELHDCLLNKDHASFWKSWKSKFVSKSGVSSVINGCSSPAEVATMFADTFEKACLPNSSTNSMRLFKQFLEYYDGYIHRNNKSDPNMHISVELIDCCLHKMKLHKASGIDGLETEHLLYAHPILIYCLSVLFNSCLQHGYVPNDFGIGLIIPIIKDKQGDSCNINNYRGITLSPVISKLFEMCLMELVSNFLESSDLQFGFKKNIGCRDAILTMRAVSDYYTKLGSTVNVCLLDMSKAFDKVNHHGLYIKLMQRDVPPAFLHVLMNWYGKCSAVVRWVNSYSYCFMLKSGVRQGGVLSPLLFSIYVDDIISKLQKSRLGCSVFSTYLGCLMYADDLVLMSASMSVLQNMIDVCASEAEYLDMTFNASKSCVVRIGKLHKRSCASVQVTGQDIPFMTCAKYLGVHILSGSHFRLDTRKPRAKYFKALNSIFSKCFGKMDDLVILHLIETYCKPILLYGFECVNLSKTDIETLSHAWNCIYWKLFRVSDKNCISDVQQFLNHMSISKFLSQRKCKYVKLLQSSSSSLMHIVCYIAHMDF